MADPSVPTDPTDPDGGISSSSGASDAPDDTLARRALMVRWHGAPDDEVGERTRQMRRLAAATRQVIDRLVGTVAPAEALAAAAEEVERVAALLGGAGRTSVYEGYAEIANTGGDVTSTFEHSPFFGLANPLSPPLALWGGERGVEAEVVFGAAYEGPPGCVHGGYIAGAFDEVLGAAQTYSGNPGMTGTLTIKYRSPTPLHTPLRMVGEYVRTEGRRVYTVGSLWAGDRLCAEAEGIFVSVPAARFAQLIAEREAARSETDDAG